MSWRLSRITSPLPFVTRVLVDLALIVGPYASAGFLSRQCKRVMIASRL
jgi:hypothetical protein